MREVAIALVMSEKTMVAIWLAAMALFRVTASAASAFLSVEIIMIRMEMVVITDTTGTTECDADILITLVVDLRKVIIRVVTGIIRCRPENQEEQRTRILQTSTPSAKQY